MLLQSHNGQIAILPALPSVWPDGRVQGLRARGGLEIGIVWRDGGAISATIEAAHDGVFQLCPPSGQRIERVECGGTPVSFEQGDNDTVSVELEAGKAYDVSFQ